MGIQVLVCVCIIAVCIPSCQGLSLSSAKVTGAEEFPAEVAIGENYSHLRHNSYYEQFVKGTHLLGDLQCEDQVSGCENITMNNLCKRSDLVFQKCHQTCTGCDPKCYDPGFHCDVIFAYGACSNQFKKKCQKSCKYCGNMDQKNIETVFVVLREYLPCTPQMENPISQEFIEAKELLEHEIGEALLENLGDHFKYFVITSLNCTATILREDTAIKVFATTTVLKDTKLENVIATLMAIAGMYSLHPDSPSAFSVNGGYSGAYTFSYAVRDDYSGALYTPDENTDAHGSPVPYYVALPDGRIQIVTFALDHGAVVAASVNSGNMDHKNIETTFVVLREYLPCTPQMENPISQEFFEAKELLEHEIGEALLKKLGDHFKEFVIMSINCTATILREDTAIKVFATTTVLMDTQLETVIATLMAVAGMSSLHPDSPSAFSVNGGYSRAYAFSYAVKDDYSGALITDDESTDAPGTPVAYTVALPDGRIQTVAFALDHGEVVAASQESATGVPY